MSNVKLQPRIPFGKGRTVELTDEVCKQIHLFNAAVHSTNLNNLGWPDPGDYQVLNRNCGTWAQLMINRVDLDFPLHESVIGNLGGGIGGLNDLTKVGDVTTFTLKSIFEMGERLESYFGL